MEQQANAVKSGYWPLLRYNPALRGVGRRPFVLDSPRPSVPLEDYAYNEMRYKVLKKTHPEDADALMRGAQELVDRRWQTYEYLAAQEAPRFQPTL